MTILICTIGTALTCGAAGFVGYKLGQRSVLRDFLGLFGGRP